MRMKKIWVNISLINLCTLAVLGMLLRSKSVFEIPFIDYNHLVDAHGHFAFGAWVTLVLTCLMVYELLPAQARARQVYQWCFTGFVVASWIMMLSGTIQGNSVLTKSFSGLFIIFSYLFSAVFIHDIWGAKTVSRPVRILAVSSLVSFVLSSSGAIALIILFRIQSLNAIYYRDALFTYLHLQYNGFFVLAVFALLFHKIMPVAGAALQKTIGRFAILLSLSILPSLFLSYLWHDPRLTFRIIAVAGSVLVFLSFIWFVVIALAVRKYAIHLPATLRYLGVLSMTAFGIKEFLQGFTIFSAIGDAVFGSRPTIIGFLHLVFLGMVSLFILGWYLKYQVLSIKSVYTRFSLIFFSIAVLLNEAVLMLQGLGSMFIIGYSVFSWMLWGISIMLLAGALMILWAGIKSGSY